MNLFCETTKVWMRNRIAQQIAYFPIFQYASVLNRVFSYFLVYAIPIINVSTPMEHGCGFGTNIDENTRFLMWILIFARNSRYFRVNFTRFLAVHVSVHVLGVSVARKYCFNWCFHTGEAINCWVCSTDTDQRCNDPMNMTKSAIEDCSRAPHSAFLQPVCKKQKQRGNTNS